MRVLTAREEARSGSDVCARATTLALHGTPLLDRMRMHTYPCTVFAAHDRPACMHSDTDLIQQDLCSYLSQRDLDELGVTVRVEVDEERC